MVCEAAPWGCSSAGRASALQAGGRRFNPVQLHQLIAARVGIFDSGKEGEPRPRECTKRYMTAVRGEHDAAGSEKTKRAGL